MAITRTAKGTAASKSSGTTLTISSVSVAAGAALVVGICWEEDHVDEKPVITFGNRTLKFVVDSQQKQGDTIVRIYKTRVKASKAKDISAVWPSAHTARAMFATEITESSAKDVGSTNGNTSGTAPTTGTAATSTIADTISIAAFAALGPDTDTAATAGAGHTIGQRIGTNGGVGLSNVTLQETYEILSATGNVRSTLTLTTARVVAASIVAFAAVETFEVKINQTRHIPRNVFQGSNEVQFDIEDSANVEVIRITMPTDIFDILTDQQVTDYISSVCNWHADRSENENPREDPDSDIETRLATFEQDTITV